MKELILTFVFLFVLTASQAQSSNGFISQKSIKVQVFPNPTSSFFRIEEKNNEVATIRLYNLLGKQMKTFDSKKTTDFYVNDLTSGLYLVQMVNDRGQIVATSRLTKR